MYKDKRILAIIPARSGSKGLLDKNIKILNGKPLLAYSIEAAKKTGVCDEIFVSTDSEEYKKIAEENGATVPFLRDKKLATDTASTWDVVVDAIASFQNIGKVFDTCIILQPTSPLRTEEDILKALAIYVKKDANMVTTVCETDHSPLWENTLPENGCMNNFFRDEIKGKRRQDLPDYYRINGAVYILRTEHLVEAKDQLYDAKSYASVMEKENSIDIDDEIDFKIAEVIEKMKA